MKNFGIIIIFIIFFNVYQTYSFSIDDINTKIQQQYGPTKLNLVEDKVGTKIQEINVLRRSPGEEGGVVVGESKEIYNNNKSTPEVVDRTDHSNEGTIGEYNNENIINLPIIFKPLSEDLIRKRVENDYKQHLLNILMLEFENQKRKIPRYTGNRLIEFSGITVPGVMGYKKANQNVVRIEENPLNTKDSSQVCPVGQTKNRGVCVPSPNRTPNNYSNIDVCKNGQSLINGKCQIVDDKTANSVYKENKIKDGITSVGIVVEKPQNNSQTINNKMSVDPNLLKDTKIFQLSPTPRDCYGGKTNLNGIMVCPNDFLEYLNKFK